MISEELRLRLPNVIVAGAPRCGTTSFFTWASAHPQIATSRKKETRYLIDEGYPLFNRRSNFATQGLTGYARLFPDRQGSNKPVYLEATPDYLYQHTARRVLADLPTKPVTVFILRNPVDRMLSLYHYAMNNVGSLYGGLSLSDCLVASRDGVSLGDDEIINQAFSHSEYHVWLEKWIAAVGRERTLVYFFDDLAKDPRSLMRDFCIRINIDVDFYRDFDFKPANQGYLVRSSALARAKWIAKKYLPANLPTRTLFRFYRAINVQRRVSPLVADAAIIEETRERFSEPNRKLARLLSRELPCGWG